MIVCVKKWSLFLDLSVQSPIFCTQKQPLLLIGPLRAAYCCFSIFWWSFSCAGLSLAAFSPSPNTWGRFTAGQVVPVLIRLEYFSTWSATYLIVFLHFHYRAMKWQNGTIWSCSIPKNFLGCSDCSPILSKESFQKVKILLPFNQIAKEAEGGISFLATR